MATVSGFTVGDLEEFSRVLRTIGQGAADMVEVADRVCRYLYEHLGTDERSDCLTVLVHKTHRFGTLPPHLQRLARQADDTVEDSTACLTRLSVCGYEEPDPEPRSIVQPLTQRAFDEQPVLVSMLLAMGLDIDSAIDPSRALSLGVHRRDLEHFLVADVPGSEIVADDEARAQVAALDLQSMLGIGGGLPSGDLFLLFLFTCTTIDERSADLLRSLATAIKASLIPHTLAPFGSR